MSLALWSLERKCSETAVGLEMLVRLSTAMFVEAVLESSFGFSYVLFVTTIALYHVNNVFTVTVNVMMNGSCVARRIKCTVSESVCYIVACQAVVSTSKRATGWLLWLGLRGLALTNKLLRLLLRRKATKGVHIKNVGAAGR